MPKRITCVSVGRVHVALLFDPTCLAAAFYAPHEGRYPAVFVGALGFVLAFTFTPGACPYGDY